MSSDTGLAPLSPRQPPVEAVMPELWRSCRSPKMMSYGGLGTGSQLIPCLFAANFRFVTMDGGTWRCAQPLTELQESVVQTLPSSQLVGLCGHVPLAGLQVSSV